MKINSANIMLAELSYELEDYKDDIDWEFIAEKFDLIKIIGQYEEFEGFYCYGSSIDNILENTFNKDVNIFLEMLEFISYRYKLEYCIDLDKIKEDIENSYQLENNLNFAENEGLKVFISYSTKNKRYANKIKEFFSNIEVNSFLAENDIETSEEWRERIFEELISSNIFIFVLSEEFKHSKWCGQEAGMAFLKRKLNQGLIFPISIDGTEPYGFFDIFQAKPCKNDTMIKTLNIIDKEYSTNLSEKMDSYRSEKINYKIEDLLKANSFIDASNVLYALTKNLDFMIIDQANKIFEYSSINDQVYNCYKCEKHLKIIFNKFKNDKINVKYLEKLGLR
jgi:TIR domain-containing protein